MVKALLKTALYVTACMLMGACVGLLLLTGVLLSVQAAVALKVAPVALTVTQLMPTGLAFWGVLASPLGGVFRTDFVVLALAAFLAGCLVRKIAKAL